MFYLKWICSFIFYNFASFSFALVNPYPGVVRLIGETETGTGAFITSDILSTANHVAETGPLYFIDDSTGKIAFTRVLHVDENHDLALLKVVGTLTGHPYESEDFYPLDSLDETGTDLFQEQVNIRSKKHFHQEEIGELVTIPGFPQGSFNIVQGVVTEYREIVKGVRGIRGGIIRNVFWVAVTDLADDEISYFSGISGSPVFSEDDQFMGVVVAGNDPDDILDKELGFVSVEELRDLARRKEDIVVKISPSEREEIMRIIAKKVKSTKYPKSMDIMTNLGFRNLLRESVSDPKSFNYFISFISAHKSMNQSVGVLPNENQ